MIASTSTSSPRAGHDRALADLGDAVGDELDVLAAERRIPLVRRQDALAAERVAGLDLAAQLGVGDLAVHVLAGELLDELHQPRPLDEAEHPQLERGVDAAADEPLQQREAAVEAALARADRAVGVGQDPRRRALEDVHPLDLRGDRRDELDRRGAGADDGDALAGDVVGVVPLRGVEHPALEAVQALDLGRLRVAERAGGGDEHAGADAALGRSRRASAARPRPSRRRSRSCSSRTERSRSKSSATRCR